MKRLSPQGIEELKRLLFETNADYLLLPELLDHLACEAEERMWDGQSSADALASLRREITPEIVQTLNLDHQNLLAMNTSLDEIVFEGRNKAYGAYALRLNYAKNVQKAFAAGILLFLTLMYVPRLVSSLKPEKKVEYIVETAFTDIRLEQPKEEIVVPPPPAEEAPVQRQVRYLPPEVVTDVVEESPPPTIDALENAQISSQNVEGELLPDLIVPPTELVGPSKGAVIGAESAVEEKIFTSVEQQPEFFGGQDALMKFLGKNIRYPSQAARANIQGRVILQFTVMPDGSIADIQTVKGIGFGCDEEAERVVRLMPKWKPGRQAGKAVRVRFTLPVYFSLQD